MAEIVEKKTIDRLTSESVTILTQNFIDLDGVLTQVGQNHRVSYENSDTGRKELEESQPAEVITAVMAIWGDSPTVETPVIDEQN